jgi:GNAT superfamily N-acetyltransferase
MTKFSIEQLSAAEAGRLLPQLFALLKNAVDNGASVSFLPPLSGAEGTRFWQKVSGGIEGGQRVVLVAKQTGQVVGTVQLELSQTPNGLHRAEVQKLLVHTEARGQGIATALMEEVERIAKAIGRTLLYLDTCKGHSAEPLYRKLGWTEAGVIPGFARVPEGFCDTVLFYKQL